MGADRGAFRPRRAFALAALHLGAHLGVHLFQRDVADPLLGHDRTFLCMSSALFRRLDIDRGRRPVSCALA